ncbi:MAG: four helix bundle protein [Bacteroidota bacterium]|nr:four helix bundle protein [Bacteroidota bacterium]
MERSRFELGERCFQLSLLILKEIENMKGNKLPYSLIDQMVRSVTSVGANVIEGQGSGTTKELIRYYRIALKSANESKYWIRLVLESFELTQNKNLLIAKQELEELSKIIASIIIKLNMKIIA